MLAKLFVGLLLPDLIIAICLAKIIFYQFRIVIVKRYFRPFDFVFKIPLSGGVIPNDG